MFAQAAELVRQTPLCVLKRSRSEMGQCYGFRFLDGLSCLFGRRHSSGGGRRSVRNMWPVQRPSIAEHQERARTV